MKHVIMFKNIDNLHKDIQVLVSDTFNCAVLDSGCTSTVCGTDSLSFYLDSFGDRKLVRMTGDKIWLRFDDDLKMPLNENHNPSEITETECFMNIAVVDSDMPPLLEKNNL